MQANASSFDAFLKYFSMKATQGFRIVHRYLGYFLAGIMAVYAISGIVLVFRNYDFLKFEKSIHKAIAPGLSEKELGKELKIRNLEIKRAAGDTLYFETGRYNLKTGDVSYTAKAYPFPLNAFVKLHLSSAKDRFYWLNVFSGGALLFFSVSAFFMYLPKSKILKKGILFALAGFALTLILLFFP